MKIDLPPALPEDAHKGLAGRVLCVAGSATMPGAAILAARAALRAGAGLVQVAHLAGSTLPIVAGAVPEVTHLDLSQAKELQVGRQPAGLLAAVRDATLLGPGLGNTGRTRELTRSVLMDGARQALVLDADGLNVLGEDLTLLKNAGSAPLVLTPHPGEAARLLGRAIPREREGRRAAARELAERSGAVIVLKGHGTWIVDGEREALCEGGNPGMATAGSGDVLAGILAAYLARLVACGSSKVDPFQAAVAATAIHARAGDLAAAARGARALIASDLIEFLGAAQQEHEAKG